MKKPLLVPSAFTLFALATALGCEEARDAKQMEELMDEADPVEESLKYDVSENMYRFSFDDAPVFDDGMPAYGNPFITQGYIYPGGFLDDRPGTDAEGKPTEPDEVLGEWVCRGYMVGDGAHTESGPMVITTQYWNLYEEPGWKPGKQGHAALVNEGFESAEVGVTWRRPITGGAGQYAAARGQATQKFLGLNASEGFDLRVEFELAKEVEATKTSNSAPEKVLNTRRR